jgi:cellobiose phosphorylase
MRNGEDLAFSFLENGAIFTIIHRDTLINLFPGNPMDGGVGNIYIRRHRDQGISSFPVVGPASDSRFGMADEAAWWEGSRLGLDYCCALQLAADRTVWFWTVHLHNTAAEPQVVDVILTQDLGLAVPAAVRANELYTSQYIDHTVYQTDNYGFIICSRQNQEQEGRFPWVLHGCLDGAAGYLTDGFQFYGLSYKETGVPAALRTPELPNERSQYELALPGLQSRPIRLPAGGSAEVTFVAIYSPDHPEATSEQDLARIEAADEAFRHLPPSLGGRTTMPKTATLFNTAPVFPVRTLTPDDLDRYFGTERRHVEQRDGTVLSFFHGPGYHVVMKEKEVLTERPHGHILRSGHHLCPDDDIMSLTAWMYGVFNSHVTIGNTNFNKLLTVSRNPLNVLKSSGQRIFVRIGDRYYLLGMPSAFEMGPTSARWIYKGDRSTIIVRLWTSLQDPACFLEIAVDGPDEPAFLISSAIVVGDDELAARPRVRIDERHGRVELAPPPEELMAQRYPDARFWIVAGDAGEIERIGGDELLFLDGRSRDTPFIVIETRVVKRFTLTLTGSVLSSRRASELADTYAAQSYIHGQKQDSAEESARTVLKQARLALSAPDSASAQGAGDDIARLNDILPWFAHNALVHFTTPYGLEQFSGAAWGTRDVCQGPVEFLLATRNYPSVKQALKMVYRHQIHGTGDWPQWFMFDRYWNIAAPDSHADVVIWPLKALCAYIETTDDLAIMDEEIAYTDESTGSVTTSTASLFAHSLKQIERMEQGCIRGTALIGYGHGDWEDTLQPADPAVRGRWVSPWTVELMYQTLGSYARICARAGNRETAERLTTLCRRIKDDFDRYLVNDGTVAGLVELGPDGAEYLLHPADRRTGVHYRLLPMTRGMLSGMFTPEQMWHHLGLIDRHLIFPDGAHLMDRPVTYHGGTERMFKRAETAANFGREIGLQYVHAHIRYIEAMCMIGRPDEAFEALMKIIPIGIQDEVPSALPRQSNAYFSSSDAAFNDRYEAREHIDRVKTLEVGVKGGWRVYSSGPGLIIAELIVNMLGLREQFSDVLLDPVLSKRLDGLTFDFEYAGKRVRYLYHVGVDGFSPRRVVVNGADLGSARYADNPYRRGGLLIPKSDFIRALNRDESVVEIFI